MIAEVTRPFAPIHGPTPRQQQILAYIRAYIRQEHMPPTVREIGNGVGLASSATVQNHLNALERKGLIHRRPRQDRTIVVLEDWR